MTGFKLYFQGAEQRGWQRLLVAEGVQNLGISFTYYWRRVKRSNWALPEFPEGTSVLLDSGGFGANKEPGQLDAAGWLEYEQAYMEFVDDNLERIEIATEFDLQILGHDHIRGMREAFWDGLGSKFMPIWHPQYGQEELDRLGRRYERVGIPGTALAGLTWLPQRINGLARQHGTKFHGMALTKPEVLRDVHFATAASTSWISPSKFGDTQVFDGERLRRYPKRYKAQARKRHKMLFQRAGFDPGKILADDPVEVTRFTVWSWRRFEDALSRRRGSDSRPTTLANGHVPDVAQNGHAAVDRLPARRSEGTNLLPVLEIDDGSRPAPAPERTVRACNNCYVAANCPAHRDDAECAYSLPLELKNRDQLLSFLHGLVEMQAQRVMFGRFTEELEGGYPDPNLSGEIDRMMKLVAGLKDIEDNREMLKIGVEARAGSGMISRLFGQAPPPERLPRPIGPAETDMAIAHVIEADAVEE